MRNTFFDALCDAAAEDERIWLVCGDLGYSVLEPFAERFPGRFVNAGVAEQNMTGVAAGLAMAGKVVFTYSIANFPLMRCLEQIRNDVCYHDLNVKIVAVGGGVAYGTAGYSHHAVEDLAVMRALPKMTVVAPGDPVETRALTRQLAATPGPAYLRLGKAGEPIVHDGEPDLRLGRAVTLREGSDVTLISTGASLRSIAEAADLLAARGLSARVISMHTVKPLDEEAIVRAAEDTRLLCVVSEHVSEGGLSDAVARVLAGRPELGAGFVSLDLQSGHGAVGVVGGQSYLTREAGLAPDQIADTVARRLEGVPA